jgi:hypothetical protein
MYKYAMNEKGNTFYRIDLTHTTYSIIPEDIFYKESSYKKSELQKLRTSVYPTQGNDYLLLKHEGKMYPVDYKVVPLVKYLWSQHIETNGWNQPDEANIGFISMEHYTRTNESSLAFLQKITEGLPTKVVNYYHQETNNSFLEKTQKELSKLLKKGYIVLSIYSNFISISFDEASMKALHKKLHLKVNQDRLPGGGIIWSGILKDFKKVKA